MAFEVEDEKKRVTTPKRHFELVNRNHVRRRRLTARNMRQTHSPTVAFMANSLRTFGMRGADKIDAFAFVIANKQLQFLLPP